MKISAAKLDALNGMDSVVIYISFVLSSKSITPPGSICKNYLGRKPKFSDENCGKCVKCIELHVGESQF